MRKRLRPKHLLVAVTAITQFALAWTALTSRSLAVERFGAWDISPRMVASAFIIGAVILIFHRNAWGFYVATLPLLIYVTVSILVVLEAHSGYGAGVVRTYMMFLLYYAYATGVGNHHVK